MRSSTIICLIIVLIFVVGCACSQTQDDADVDIPPPAPPSSGGNPAPQLFPPIFVQDIPSYTTLIEDQQAFELDLLAYATDSPNDPHFTQQNQLVWSVSGFDSNILTIVILNNHIARFIPKPNGFGQTQATFTVQDLTGLSASRTIAIQFANIPDAPLITSAPITSATVNTPYNYLVQAIDPDEDTITFTLTEKPTGMTIEAGTISWTPAATGVIGVSVRAQDSTGRITVQSYTITIT